MRGQAGFWDIEERYARLSDAGDPLEKPNTVLVRQEFREGQVIKYELLFRIKKRS